VSVKRIKKGGDTMKIRLTPGIISDLKRNEKASGKKYNYIVNYNSAFIDDYALPAVYRIDKKSNKMQYVTLLISL